MIKTDEVSEQGCGWHYDIPAGVWTRFDPRGTHPGGYSLRLMDIDNLGRMVAVQTRTVDGYTQSWWLRPQ
jgi:hypothetical protein